MHRCTTKHHESTYKYISQIVYLLGITGNQKYIRTELASKGCNYKNLEEEESKAICLK